jgi:hypothetical protein
VKTFIGVCLKLLLLLCLFFSFYVLAGDWPEFNPQDKGCIDFYLTQANEWCEKMEKLQEDYPNRAADIASQAAPNPHYPKRNPLYRYEELWMPVWCAYSKDPQNRLKTIKISLKDFGDSLVGKVKIARATLKKKAKTNPPFNRETGRDILVSLSPGRLRSPLKIGGKMGNTWHLPTALPLTCMDSPDKHPSPKTPPSKNSNMIRLGLGKAPRVKEIVDGEEKYRSCDAHHMSQKDTDENIILLPYSVHKTHSRELHGVTKESKIDRAAFAKEKKFISKVFAARLTRKWLQSLKEQLNPRAIPFSATASASDTPLVAGPSLSTLVSTPGFTTSAPVIFKTPSTPAPTRRRRQTTNSPLGAVPSLSTLVPTPEFTAPSSTTSAPVIFKTPSMPTPTRRKRQTTDTTLVAVPSLSTLVPAPGFTPPSLSSSSSIRTRRTTASVAPTTPLAVRRHLSFENSLSKNESTSSKDLAPSFSKSSQGTSSDAPSPHKRPRNLPLED